MTPRATSFISEKPQPDMPYFYQTVCRTEREARTAWDATEGVFDGLGEVTGHARKRHAESLSWRFDDDLPVVERMLAALGKTGRFIEIREVQEEFYWRTRSHAV